jgi:Gpi18-like mannosyltransferase
VSAALREGKINPDREESEIERVDRNLEELLQELRVAIPGIQVLFAFLLVLPFNQRFSMLTANQEKLYYAILVCTAIAAALLIAPSMHHRLQFRMNRKRRILLWSHRLAITGLSLLAVGMTGAVFLVGDFVFDSTWAAIGAGIPAFLIIMIWFIAPLLNGRDPDRT